MSLSYRSTCIPTTFVQPFHTKTENNTLYSSMKSHFVEAYEMHIHCQAAYAYFKC